MCRELISVNKDKKKEQTLTEEVKTLFVSQSKGPDMKCGLNVSGLVC